MKDRFPFRREHTGSAGADRLQADARRASIALQHQIDQGLPLSLALRDAYTTTSADLQVTPLWFPVKAGDLWELEFWGFGACSSVNGMRYGIGAPDGSNVSGTIETSSTNTLVANWLIGTFTAANTASITCHAGATNAGRPDRIYARVKAASAGRIALLVASVTSGTTTTLAAQAYLRAHRYLEAA